MKKYVFIIDLDSTIIGDCSYQLQLYNISKIINNSNSKQSININKVLSPYYNEKLKLVRPYFVYFINKMRELYKQDVYFYVYMYLFLYIYICTCGPRFIGRARPGWLGCLGGFK